MLATKSDYHKFIEIARVRSFLGNIFCFTIAFLLTRMRIQNQCSVCAIAFVSALGGGGYGFFSLLGAVIGYFFYHDVSAASLYMASTLFVYTILYVMQFTRVYKYRVFGSAVTLVVLAIVLSFEEISVDRIQSLFSQSYLIEVFVGAVLSYVYSYGIRDEFLKSSESMGVYSRMTLFVSLAVAISDITSTELGYLDGVTSNI